jgi:hypothetical protein
MKKKGRPGEQIASFVGMLMSTDQLKSEVLEFYVVQTLK